MTLERTTMNFQFIIMIIAISLQFTLTICTQPKSMVESDQKMQEDWCKRINSKETQWKPGQHCTCKTGPPYSASCVLTINGAEKTIHTSPALVGMAMSDLTIANGSELRSGFVPWQAKNFTEVHPLLGVVYHTENPFAIEANEPSGVWIFESLKFTLFDVSNKATGGQVIFLQDKFIAEKVKKYDKIFFAIHGFMSDSSTLEELKNVLLLSSRWRGKQAIILVDWRDAASPFIDFSGASYDTQAMNSAVVGRYVGVMTHLLVKSQKVDTQNVHLIGFSLGAHVTHYAAVWFMKIQYELHNDCGKLRKIGRITGLEPAAPFFSSTASFLNKHDANFVDILHTSAVEGHGGKLECGVLARCGFRFAVGHVDIYMNGGWKQPSCGEETTCHHSRAYHFLAKAYNETEVGYNFEHMWAVKCACAERFDKCLQESADFVEDVTMFGLEVERNSAQGIFYLNYDFVDEHSNGPAKRPENGTTGECENAYETHPVLLEGTKTDMQLLFAGKCDKWA